MKKDRCFGTIYKFELLKILKNKVAVITFLILFGFMFVQGEFEVSGNVEMDEFKNYAKLDGRKLDDKLLGEFNEVTNEYGEVINEKDRAYGSLEEWIKDIAGYGVALQDISETTLYEKRIETIDEAYRDSYLDEGEIAYWKEQEKTIDKPFEWKYTLTAVGVQEGISNITIMMLLVIAAGLSAVFSIETQRRTDSIIKASINGQKEIYFAKILAGATYCFFTVTLLIGSFLLYVRLKWGFDSLDAAEQVIYPFTQMKMTAGELACILVALSILGSFFMAAVAMFLSCVLRNTMGTMIILIGGYIGLFALGTSIPMEFKTLSKCVDLLPSFQVSQRVVYEFRLFKVAGHYFRSYQVAPVTYVSIAFTLIVWGYFIYRKQEIKSS